MRFLIKKYAGALEIVDYEELSILAPCLLKLSEKYFKSKRASRGSLVVINLVPNPRSFLQRKMLEAINEDKKHALGVMVKDGRKKHLNASAWGVTDKAQSYLLLMLAMDDLDVTLKQWKGLPTWNPLAQTVIVVMDPIEGVKAKNLLVREVFEKLFAEGIINANVMYQLNDNDHRMISESWFPYLNSSCAKIVENIYKVDECIVTETVDRATNKTTRYNNVTEINEELYPKIPSRFHGCPLYVSAFIWEPFVVNTDNSSESDLSGIEILMLKTITSQMALKIKYKFLDDKLLTERISDDNQTGIYADLLQK
jgi:hypothetical protein